MSTLNKRKRGYLTFAINNEKQDYVRLAYGLALSLRLSQQETPYLSVVVTDPDDMPEKYKKVFDNVIQNPWGDDDWDREWKLRNEWKSMHLTPYEETIKTEADMLYFDEMEPLIDHIADRQDVAICDNVRTFQDQVADMTFYRKTFVNNNLYNAYSAMSYFKQGDESWKFFELIKEIADNWSEYSYEFLRKYRQQEFSTDVAYGLAVRLLDKKREYKPCIEGFNFVHMKMLAQLMPEPNTHFDDDWDLWLDNRMNDNCELFVNNYYISRPFHYHVKDWLTDEIIEQYEAKLGL